MSMNINQMRVSRTIFFFKKDLLEKYKLKEYHSKNSPAFFYGIYTKTDLKAVIKHNSMKIIIWSGSDINIKECDRVKEWIKELRNLKNIYFISNSRFISNDMRSLKLPFRFLPISGVKINRFKPIKKGKSIYIYTSATKPSTYGKHLYEKIIKRLPQFNFILATNKSSIITAKKRGVKIDDRILSFNKNNIVQIYKKCFIGLRLTEHDGISYTVAEMGLCGIKCIHNGGQPNAIGYNGLEDIIKSIIKESKMMGTIDMNLALRTKKYLSIKSKWKDPKFYSK